MVYEITVGSKVMTMDVALRIHSDLPKLEFVLIVETDDFKQGVPKGAFNRTDFPCCNEKGLCTNEFTFFSMEDLVRKMTFLKNKFETYYEFQKDFSIFVEQLNNLKF